jgi:hypothetical protein
VKAVVDPEVVDLVVVDPLVVDPLVVDPVVGSMNAEAPKGVWAVVREDVLFPERFFWQHSIPAICPQHQLSLYGHRVSGVSDMKPCASAVSIPFYKGGSTLTVLFMQS